MGIETALLGGAAAIIGGAQAAKGTPDQRTYKSQTTSFAGPGSQERDLQNASLQQYIQSLQQADAYEQGIGGAMDYQTQARRAGLDILGGQGMQANPEEIRMIEQQRMLRNQQAQADIDQFINQRLMQVKQDAARRGVQGQAFSTLQSRPIEEGTRQLASAQRQNALLASQQQFETPYRRIQTQSPFIQQGMSLGDLMRQQAFMNRQATQSPYLMGQLQRERMAAATTTGEDFTPGRKGDFWDIAGGVLGGASMGAGAARNFGFSGGGGTAPKPQTRFSDYYGDYGTWNDQGQYGNEWM